MADLNLETELSHIARQVVQKHPSPRVEYDDMLQEARVAAWQAKVRGYAKGLSVADLKRYALGAARNECERVVAKTKEDVLYHCENHGLLEDLPDDAESL